MGGARGPEPLRERRPSRPPMSPTDVPALPAPHTRVGVGGVLIREDRALVNRASYRTNFTIPSGYVEPGESAEQAVAREFEEETGVTVRVGRLLLARHKVVRADESDVYFAFELEQGTGEAEARGPEIVEVRWVPLRDVPTTLWISELSRLAIRLAQDPAASGWPRSPWKGGAVPGLATELFHRRLEP